MNNEKSALKLGTDAVLLGAAVTLSSEDRNLLDIGTGTGIIALMAAQRAESAGADCRIEAIDIDAPSCEEASLNFTASPWSGKLSVMNTALQGFKPECRYDLVFSNPPYYDESLKNPDERESAARHTECLSYRQICAFCSENLTDSGRLSLILPSDCETALRRTAASFGLYPFRLLRIRTTASKPARRLIAEFSRNRVTPSEEELVLQDGPDRTPEYKALTSDFYL